jgi:acetyl-CoA C-acetyltransferase
MESRTNAPYLVESRFFKRGAHYARGERLRVKKTGAYRWQFSENGEEQADLTGLVDATAYDGLFWPPEKKFMREYALAFAKAHGVSVDLVNELASLSHQKARQARAEGFFDAEIVPIGDVVQDELPTAEELAELRKAEPQDIATSYNTSIPADNASAMILCSSTFAARHFQKPMARVLGFSRIDRPAAEFLDSPIEAVKMLLAALGKSGYAESRFEIFELNEAFGIQLPIFMESFPGKSINVNGGAVALGHPLGSAGARLVVTLLHSMKRLKIGCGIASLCFGGGGAYAVAVESID